MMRDLGTLGGLASFAKGINSNRCVVGGADTKDGTRRAFLWTPAAGMRQLDIPWAVSSQAEAINDRGQIVGTYAGSDGNEGVFIWTADDGARVIPTPYRDSGVECINARGQVLITAYDSTEDVSYHTDVIYRIMVWSECEGLRELDSPYPDDYVEVYDVMDSGHIVGGAMCPGPFSIGDFAFLLSQEGQVTILPRVCPQDMLYELNSCAHSGNGRGQIVGEMIFGENERHAWLWTPRDADAVLGAPFRVKVHFIIVDRKGNTVKSKEISHEQLTFMDCDGQKVAQFEAFDHNGRPNCYALHVDNDLGYGPQGERTATYMVVVNKKGKTTNVARLPLPKPVLYTMTDLGTLGGKRSLAIDINERGQVVGRSDDSDENCRAFIWSEEDGMRDLGTLGGRNSAAFAINDSGVVVGWTEDAEGRHRAFIAGL